MNKILERSGPVAFFKRGLKYLHFKSGFVLVLIFFIFGGIMSSSFALEPAVTERMHPRVGVGVIVQKDGKVLLGPRKGSHGSSKWAPPGGHLEFGESVEECARRELLEETGLNAISCTLGPWVENVMENGRKHYITVYVIVDQFEGEPLLLEPDKCEVWQWVAWDQLPSPLFDSLASFIEHRK